ncbi:MAG: ABC transporter ATP-binding protein/permease [Actinomycetota bacterium]|nr:ABC transporter ATP-binding protein/permease [Actinomycetota bacterium]
MSSTRRALGLAIATAFRADPWRATGVLLTQAFASVVGVLTAFWLKQIVDAAVSHDQDAALVAAVAIGATAGVGLMAAAISTRMLFPLKENTALYLDRRIVALVSGIPGVEHHERPKYLDRLEVLRNEMDTLGFAGMHTAGAFALVVRVMATGVLLASINPLLLAVPLFAVPSLWAGAKAERIRQTALDSSADKARRGRQLFELATSPAAGKELRVFGVGDELLRRHRADWRDVDRVLDGASRRGMAWEALSWIVFSAGYAAAILLVVDQAVTGGASIGDVVLALALVAQVNGQVSAAVGTVSQIVRTVKVAERYLWLTDYAETHQAVIDDPAPPPDRLTYGIELRGVAFRYPGSTVDVLGEFDLFLPAGATVAVVGDNGAGKSTLVKLLCRFYEPSKGVITVDGTDLRRIDIGAWRERMSAGFQDFSRFELQATETIGVGDVPFINDSAAVATALERAASANVVDALPNGLETQLGTSFDSGVELSGGQWQKLALARAMMRPAPLLLVLDEPTAALDAETEHTLFARYAAAASGLAARNGAITLMVSHRFSTVRMADLIVLDGARLVEVGTHDELMAKSGQYSELYSIQAAAYR